MNRGALVSVSSAGVGDFWVGGFAQNDRVVPAGAHEVRAFRLPRATTTHLHGKKGVLPCQSAVARKPMSTADCFWRLANVRSLGGHNLSDEGGVRSAWRAVRGSYCTQRVPTPG